MVIMKSSIILRTRILCGIFILVALLLLVRLYFVQIIHSAEYQSQSTAQYIQTNPETVDRGSIFFSTKDGKLVSAAASQGGYMVAINPNVLVDGIHTYGVLKKIIDIDEATFINATHNKNSSFVTIKEHIDDAQAAAIQKSKIQGVIISPQVWREYPGRERAAQAIGFLGYSGTSTIRVGQYGLERFYDTTLSKSTTGLYVNPFAEIFANIQDLVTTDPIAHQGSLITTIEPNVQTQLEKVLSGVMHTYHSQFSGGIVMNPHTGEIYAIAGAPSFDPNDYGSVTDPAQYQNHLVEGRYELGSIMKPLTMAAGLDSGAITLSSTYNDTGCIEVSTYKVCNFDHKARGVIPMQEILSQSLNVGVSYVATKTGYPVFTRYMRLFGFGDMTGVDLPNEVAGDIRQLGVGNGPAVNYDAASFGQGISVSPIEMIRALSVLANQGKLPSPHIVKAIKYDSGITRTIPIMDGPQVIQPATADTVTSMLTKVFDTALLKGKLKQERYSFAAKTGTAQIPMPGGGYYPAGTYLHSFFGYFPAHDPEFIVFLFAWKPQGQEYASATLAQPFMDIAQYLINYYNVPPDR
jgi:cell division protein FtsI/penicillin-binding protein 2